MQNFDSPSFDSTKVELVDKKKKEKSRFFSVSQKTSDLIFFNFSFEKNRLKNVVSWFLENYGQYKTLQLLEKFKEYGFGYATKAGISLGIDDLKIPAKKISMIWNAETKVAKDFSEYRNATITGVERTQRLMYTWNQTNDLLKQEVLKYFEKRDLFNPIYMMAFSGARGNMSQVRQLVGMRGLMSDPQGQIIDFPIQSNFREGLTLTEYLISTYGARKGIVDTALRTATAGYLTRRLVDVAQHILVSQFDCGTRRGIFLFDMKDAKKTIYSFQNRLVGRVLAEDIFFSPEIQTSKNFIAFRNQEIDSTCASLIANVTKKALVRSPLTCETSRLICQLCYGWSLSQGKLVSIGEAVGVLAAQSIGEPGTQLTMRTFHTGGVFAGGLTDQILAPFDGKIAYLQTIPGSCIRTSLSEIAFFTKAPGAFFLSDFCETEEKKKKKFSEIFKIPTSALLFFRKNEKILKNQVIAQFSTLSKKQLQYGTAEQTLFSTLAGEFYFQTSLLSFSQKNDSKKIELFLEKRKEEDGTFASLEFKSDILWKVKNWTNIWILSGKILFQPFESNLFLQHGDFLQQTTPVQRILWKKTKNWELFFQTQNRKTVFSANSFPSSTSFDSNFVKLVDNVESKEIEQNFQFSKKKKVNPFLNSLKMNSFRVSKLFFLPEFPFFLNFQKSFQNHKNKNQKFFQSFQNFSFSLKMQKILFQSDAKNSSLFKNFLFSFQFSKFAQKFQRSQKFIQTSLRYESWPSVNSLKGKLLLFKKTKKESSFFSFPKESFPSRTKFLKKSFVFFYLIRTPFSLLKKKNFSKKLSILDKELFFKKPIFSLNFERVRYKNLSYLFSHFSLRKNSKIFFRTLTSFQQSFFHSILQKGKIFGEKTFSTENFYGTDSPKFFTSCFLQNSQTSTNGIFSFFSFKKQLSFQKSFSLQNLETFQFFSSSQLSNLFPTNLNTFFFSFCKKKKNWKFQKRKNLFFSKFENKKRIFLEKQKTQFFENTEFYTSELTWIPQEISSFQSLQSFKFLNLKESQIFSFFSGKQMKILELSNKQGKKNAFFTRFEGLGKFSKVVSNDFVEKFPFVFEKKLSESFFFNKKKKKKKFNKTFQYLKFHSFFSFRQKRKENQFLIPQKHKKKNASSFKEKRIPFLFKKQKTKVEMKIQSLFEKTMQKKDKTMKVLFNLKKGRKAKSKFFACFPLSKKQKRKKNIFVHTSKKSLQSKKKQFFHQFSFQLKIQPGWICFFPNEFSIFDWHQKIHKKGHIENKNFFFENENVYSEACILLKKEEQKQNFSIQTVFKKNFSRFLFFENEMKNSQKFFTSVSTFEKLKTFHLGSSVFNSKKESFSSQKKNSKKREKEKPKKMSGLIFQQIQLKILENPKILKTFGNNFQSQNIVYDEIQDFIHEFCSFNSLKNYHSSLLNLQSPEKNLFLNDFEADFALFSGFPTMYQSPQKNSNGNVFAFNSFPGKKKSLLLFSKKKLHLFFQNLLSRDDFFFKGNPRKDSLFQFQKKKENKKNIFFSWNLGEKEEKISFNVTKKDFFQNSFFSFYPLQLLPLFSVNSNSPRKEEKNSFLEKEKSLKDSFFFTWDPFQSKATFSLFSKKAAFFQQRLLVKKKDERTNFQTIFKQKKSKTFFFENSLYLKNSLYYGNTKIFTPFSGEMLSISLNETNWWKKASEISTLQRFSTFFSVVRKKDLLRFSFFSPSFDSTSFTLSTKVELKEGEVDVEALGDEKKNQAFLNENSFFEKTEKFENLFLPKKQKHLFSMYSYFENQKNDCSRLKFSFQDTKKNSVKCISSLFKYQKKIYKFQNLEIGFPSLNKNPELGKFYIYGDCLFEKALRKPGQLIHMNSFSCTFRKGQPFFVSPQGFLHFSTTPYIEKNIPILTLPFQTVQSGDIVQGIPKVEQLFEARTTLNGRLFLTSFPILLKGIFHRYKSFLPLDQAVRQSFLKIQQLLVDGVQRVYRSQGVSIVDKHVEIIVRQMTTKVQIIHGAQTGFFPGEFVNFTLVEKMNKLLLVKVRYEPVVLGITRASLEVESFLSASSFQQTTKILALASISKKKDFLKGLKENILVGNLIPSGTGYVRVRQDI